MPTLISKKLSDLQTERESLTRYEQQIIQERDLILTSVRDHLLQLNREIVRLGGSPREEQGSSPDAVLSPRNDTGSQKKRGRRRKDAPLLEKMDSSNRNGRIHDGEDKENRSSGSNKQSKDSLSLSISEAWTCECGRYMAAGRARCGACRRWKGGKRLTRWTIKKDSAVVATSDIGLSCGTLEVFNTYKNLPFTEQKTASDGTSVLAEMSDSSNPRLEIEEVMNDMVSAIDLVSRATLKLKTSDDIAVATNKGDDNATETSNKRKRGRPKKSTTVSSSDSDEGSVINLPRNRGRPRKQIPRSSLDSQQTTESTIYSPEMTSSEIEKIASG